MKAIRSSTTTKMILLHATTTSRTLNKGLLCGGRKRGNFINSTDCICYNFPEGSENDLSREVTSEEGV